MTKFDFQSQLSMLKSFESFSISFSMKNTIFCYWHFLKIPFTYFLKGCPIFESSLLHQFAKFNNFLWVLMLIFRQKYIQFCTPHLKTRQPVLPYSICTMHIIRSDLLSSFLFFSDWLLLYVLTFYPWFIWTLMSSNTIWKKQPTPILWDTWTLFQ